ncbi:FMN-dependent oxidoreductase (nitrilotriacetate monooxygenase family) [Lysinibacillus parviboronicapiens]|uniref:FMN-dependent oxidoreductase (Nitrilotriacetate monooxygenase family) n=1 Tax=Lysinibacillus parviboronicapiens TaxID=436516 RepID=A0ABV2PFR1_9BACI
MTTKRHLIIGMHLAVSGEQGKKGAFIDEHIAFAQRAEAAKLDFVFKADYLIAHPELMAKTKGTAGLDPSFLFATVARETKHIGLVTTVSTSFIPPYIIARQLQSLNWISEGRLGWNLVTSIDGAYNFSNEPMPSSEERYAKAAECKEVVQQLWHSNPYEILEADGNLEIINELVKPINHEGEYFHVKGPLNIPMYPAGDIPLFQAGASETGRQFAATVSNAIFAATPVMEVGIELRNDLRKRAITAGRSADDIRLLPGLYFFIGDTYEEALEMHRKAHEHLTTERRYTALESVIGMDIRHLSLVEHVTAAMLPPEDQKVRSKTHAQLVRRYIIEHEPTVEALLARPEVIGSAHLVAIGTPQDIVNQIVTFYEKGALDGFIAVPGGPAKSLDLFFSDVIPMLVERGLFRAEYKGNTLRSHLGLDV